MADALSTAGITLKYAVETEKGTKPTTGYKIIPQVKSIPDMNQEPETLETTTLAEPTDHTYIPALRSAGGAMTHLANLNDEFMTAWDELVEGYETAKSAGLGVWFVVTVPGLAKAWYYKAIPSPLAFGGAEVGSVLEINGYLTPSGTKMWDTPPTE